MPQVKMRLLNTYRKFSIVNDFFALYRHLAAAVCPAHIGNRNEIGSWQTAQADDLGIQDCGFTAKTHGSNAHFVGFLRQAFLQLSEFWILVPCTHFTEQYFFGFDIGRATVAANGHP